MNDILYPTFGMVAILAGLAAAWVLSNWLPIPTRGRNVPLDGLRGYMAFGVFLYHSVIWYGYLRTGSWNVPAVSVYRPLGDLCVKVFFMITAYLFVGKIIDSHERPMDWWTLFVSRVMRLTPLYLFALSGLLVMTGILTRWTPHESYRELTDHIGQWVAFTMVAAPDVNRLPDTSLLVAGVTWSLAYEWLFYLSLPLLALVLLKPVPVTAVLICGCLLLWMLIIKPKVIFPWSFIFGAAAAIVARTASVARALRSPAASLAVCVVMGWIFLVQNTVFAKASTLALMLAFIPIACGNSMFGILTSRASLLLGELSYSIYLLHGLLLSVIFDLVLGHALAGTLSPWQHWMIVAGAGIALVALSTLTFRVIERPCIRSAPRLAAWSSNLGSRLARWGEA